MDWVETARRNHQAAQAALVRAANRHAVSVPIGDSDATAPGYLLWEKTYSCVPDVQYPWDRDVIRALRILQPDVMPCLSRTVLRYSNYYDQGRLGEPIVLIRHMLARAIRDPISPVHNYPVEMPSTPVPGLLIPGRSWSDCRPNYMELEFYDRNRRDYGHDYPGEYEALDWACYYRVLDGHLRMKEAAEASRREAKNGEVKAVGAAAPSIAEDRRRKAAQVASRKDYDAYVTRDREKYYSVEPSDLEWREAYLGEPKRPTLPVTVSVPENLSTIKESTV